METKLEAGEVVASSPATDCRPKAESPGQKPGPASVPHPGLVERVHKELDVWFAEVIHNSIVARTTEAYNHMVKSLSDLKARIAKALKQDL